MWGFVSYNKEFGFFVGFYNIVILFFVFLYLLFVFVLGV